VLSMPSQERISALADRIEIAYSRRNRQTPYWQASRGVWAVAAAGLLMLQRNDPAMPVDPELFVAVQPTQSWSDPWVELTQKSSLIRYRREVRRIIAQLRAEIKSEVQLVERLVHKGIPLQDVLTEAEGKCSALARYIIARRAGLDDLAERLRPSSERQHRACPLYLQACRSLLPVELYPLPRSSGLLPGLVIPAGLDLPCFSAN